jgi:hypothetical protein
LTSVAFPPPALWMAKFRLLNTEITRAEIDHITERIGDL